MATEKTIPSEFSNHINDIGDNQFGLDPLFCSFQSYPQYWLQDEDGNVEYGSIQPETREALEKIQELYTNKLIDPEMLVRSDCQEPVRGGVVTLFRMLHWQERQTGGHTSHHCLRMEIIILICRILQANM